MTWITPDEREIELKNLSIEATRKVDLTEYIPRGRGNTVKLSDGTLITENPEIKNFELVALFGDLNSDKLTTQPGTYTLRIEGIMFEEDGNLDAQLIMLGQVYGMAGTDYMRRDLLVPLLWGMPFALLIGLLGAVFTTILAMIFAAAGVWFGGWVDALIQRITEANMILPVMALGVLMYALFNLSLWTVLFIIILLNVFSSPTKSFRAAFLQVRSAPYIEAAQAYGATNTRIIFKYMIPRIIPVLIPQLVALVPGYVFLEATLGMFNIKSNFPTWGRVIYEALKYGPSYGSRYWVLQPIFLLLLTGFAFAMVGFALDKILNPRLKNL